MALRSEETPWKALKNATLRKFYEECTKEGNKRILNVLDLPMGAAELPVIPQFWFGIIYCSYYGISHIIAVIWHQISLHGNNSWEFLAF
jgi:hypothetical protein